MSTCQIGLCVQLPTLAVNVTLLEFPIERRAAALLLGCLSTSPACMALSKQTHHGCGQTMGQTDGGMLNHFKDPTQHAIRAVSTSE